MKKYIVALIISLLVLPINANNLQNILKNYDESVVIPNLSAVFTITLISQNGDKREIKAQAYQKFVDGVQMNRLFKFSYPPSVRDTGLLIHSFYNDNGDNKMWIYLPIVKKIKRIVLSNSGGGYFMGSDFSYSDLISKSSSDFIQEYAGEGEIDGTSYHIVKEYGDTEKKKELLGYAYIINYYGKDDSFLYGRDYYELSGALLKTYRVKEVLKFDKYIYPTDIEMTNVQTNHRSVISVTDISFDEVSEKFFSTRYLKK